MAEFAMKTSFVMVPRPLPVALGLLCLLAGPFQAGAVEPGVPVSASAVPAPFAPAVAAPVVASGATTGPSASSGAAGAAGTAATPAVGGTAAGTASADGADAAPAAASASAVGEAGASSPRPPPPGVPALWGYGMRPCSAFLASAPREGTPAPLGDSDYQGYREWLAGLVSGLNLATGRDVLKGAELDAALIRIRANCARDPEMDFFNASMRLIRGLGL